MHVSKLKDYLKVGGLKISCNKNELVTRVFFCYREYCYNNIAILLLLKINTLVTTYKLLTQDIDKCNLKKSQNIRCQIDLEI